MKISVNPEKKDWPGLLQRPAIDQTLLFDKVRSILQDVKKNGDAAVKKYSLQFDKVSVEQPAVSAEEINRGIKKLSPELRNAIETAANNIRRFHEGQKPNDAVIETMPGIKCWRRSVAIDKIGLYIPGGTAPLFSTVLMLGIPARLAGCHEIQLCTPPNADHEIHPAILFAAQLVGVTTIFKIGGVQAIAAMAYGTATVPAVYKIFGPGNQYVNCAKQLVQLDGVAIDMPAGPSEVCVIADESCDPSFVAADLLSQAEHGADSQVLLICNDRAIVEKVLQEINRQSLVLPRKDMAEQALRESNAIVVRNMNEAVELANEYASEHLIVACSNAEAIAEKIINAGSVFIGNYSPESAGDYASGTNHVLPTNGSARSYSGVSIDSFVKKITYQQLTKTGLEQIGDAIEIMATAEGLEAHKNAVTVRRNA